MRCETEKNLSLHSYEELYQFANQIYNQDKRRASVSQPKLVNAASQET